MSVELFALAFSALAFAGRRNGRSMVAGWGYVGGKAVELQLVDVGGGHLLRVDVAPYWEAMAAAAAADGVDLRLNSAFRSFAAQAVLRAQYEAGGAIAAQPGYSDHQGGIAVDVESASGTNAAFHWMTAKAANHRFVRTVPSEPWHWEFR